MCVRDHLLWMPWRYVPVALATGVGSHSTLNYLLPALANGPADANGGGSGECVRCGDAAKPEADGGGRAGRESRVEARGGGYHESRQSRASKAGRRRLSRWFSAREERAERRSQAPAPAARSSAAMAACLEGRLPLGATGGKNRSKHIKIQRTANVSTHEPFCAHFLRILRSIKN